MSYSVMYSDLEELLSAVSGWSTLPSLVSLAVYIFSALGLYTIAQRRGLRNSWLAWIPVANVWILGSLSDQYRYVVRNEVRSKRKVLLTLEIIAAVLRLVLTVAAIVTVARSIAFIGMADPDRLAEEILGTLMGMLVLCLPLLGVDIAKAVLYYMALYDVYTSCAPQDNVVYLVLSILFGFTRAIFLFLCRNRDDGMPPRRDQPQSACRESEETNYL